MGTEERIRAVRRVIDQVEALLDTWAELGDELSAIAEENTNCRFHRTSPATARRHRFLQASRIAIRVMVSS